MKVKALLYCTKAKPYLKKTKRFDLEDDKQFYYNENTNVLETKIFNGKIVAECDYEVEEIKQIYGSNHPTFDENGFFDDYIDYVTNTLKDEKELLKQSCLNLEEIEKYNPKYAIHIKNLHIFDEPKELSDYKYLRKTFFGPLGNAPQNMMYAYELNEYELIKKVLISIQPQWLCKILNGEKTIEVRKKVLKEMIK